MRKKKKLIVLQMLNKINKLRQQKINMKKNKK